MLWSITITDSHGKFYRGEISLDVNTVANFISGFIIQHSAALSWILTFGPAVGIAGWIGGIIGKRDELKKKGEIERELQKLKSSHAGDLARLQSSLKLSSDKEQDLLRSGHEKELQGLKAAHERELALLQAALKSSNDTEQARLNQTHERELARLNASLNAEQTRVEEARHRLLAVTAEVDLDLRKQRLEHYKELWALTKILPRYPRDENVTYENLGEFFEKLRSWYYEKGGMFLSRGAHDQAYTPLQETLSKILQQCSSGRLSNEHYDEIRRKCSYLRLALADDIKSRREAIRIE
jgi:hypothetical protein